MTVGLAAVKEIRVDAALEAVLSESDSILTLKEQRRGICSVENMFYS